MGYASDTPPSYIYPGNLSHKINFKVLYSFPGRFTSISRPDPTTAYI